jgi:NAD(P)-dependent dehydrogenase (short-subunit alcohol dehydrogenase family)
MTRSLDGLVALVTGAGSGIGAEVAARLAQDGAAVGVNGLTDDEVVGTVQRIVDGGGRAVGLVGDVSDPEDAARMVRECDEQLGGLHVLVNNAGLQEETPFLELDLETWRKQLSVDLDGAFLMALAACRLMAPRGGGVVLNVTSVHEHQPRPGYAAYCAAKAGLGMLTKVIGPRARGQGHPQRRRRPGAIETRSRATAPRRRSASRRRASRPAGWGGRARSPRLISYLVSPAAAYVSGHHRRHRRRPGAAGLAQLRPPRGTPRVRGVERTRLAVVFGGRSTEHAISCISAGSILAAVDRDRYDVVAVGITPEGRWVLAPDDPSLLALSGRELPGVKDGQAVALPGDPTVAGLVPLEDGAGVLGSVDVVFPVLHGPYGEDGTLQGLLELAGRALRRQRGAGQRGGDGQGGGQEAAGCCGHRGGPGGRRARAALGRRPERRRGRGPRARACRCS